MHYFLQVMIPLVLGSYITYLSEGGISGIWIISLCFGGQLLFFLFLDLAGKLMILINHNDQMEPVAIATGTINCIKLVVNFFSHTDTERIYNILLTGIIFKLLYGNKMTFAFKWNIKCLLFYCLWISKVNHDLGIHLFHFMFWKSK